MESFAGREEIADEFDKGLEDLRATPALILDIRDNEGGFGNAQPRIVGRFITQRTLVAMDYRKNGPAHSDLRRHEFFFSPSGEWQYTRPVALLVNDVTGSAADLFACYVRSTGRVVTLGSTTHGNLSGVAAYVVLPCNLVVRISNGYVCDAKGKPIECNGNEPDVAVTPSAADFLKGHDPVLDKAVAVLRGMIK
jgi:C-terminal processing protease CtpA/Prc